MTVVVDDPDFTLHVGDVRDVLPTLETESVDCALTSPPFYGLRDYGVDGQIGLEESPEEWCAELVAVFREVRRTLKPQGTLWIECGDSYAGSTMGGGPPSSSTLKGTHHAEREGARFTTPRHLAGHKVKDLIGAPWLLAFALRADGWYLRQAIVWHKPNAMPESVRDRCTTAHSYVFLLSKSARYWFDADAIAEPAEWARWGDQTVPKHEGTETAAGWIPPKTKTELREYTNSRVPREQAGARGFTSGTPRYVADNGMKNARSVWTIPTRGYPDAHFATWPKALVERILKAGCPEGGVCLDPFMGSGTTALVARRLRRRSVGVELSEAYAAMAAKRLRQQSLIIPGQMTVDESITEAELATKADPPAQLSLLA